eukprot:CAMPEP_0194337974 /NCGR_PEP_ID=MMETSP0171-20130528/77984_1 /TAXON_ID=218684 /ORGANISM="Corethron pennatum, Strain L29A3" /LENGTH=114 /DNA_ID=CAMNT_0039101945 /DNA_START=107 /DNA_END=448 /DNA_ORIENTATION=-
MKLKSKEPLKGLAPATRDIINNLSSTLSSTQLYQIPKRLCIEAEANVNPAELDMAAQSTVEEEDEEKDETDDWTKISKESETYSFDSDSDIENCFKRVRLSKPFDMKLLKDSIE